MPRYLGLVVLLAMAGFAAVGFFTIRKDVENLRVISQDNTQWAASQMEIELLRFRLAWRRCARTRRRKRSRRCTSVSTSCGAGSS